MYSSITNKWHYCGFLYRLVHYKQTRALGRGSWCYSLGGHSRDECRSNWRFYYHGGGGSFETNSPFKGPRTDGMPPLFYQNYWTLLGNDVTQFVLHYLNSGSLPTTPGHSFVTLIPKVKNPEFVSQFRPISLSNVLYRVFSKVLANKLKKIILSLSLIVWSQIISW